MKNRVKLIIVSLCVLFAALVLLFCIAFLGKRVLSTDKATDYSAITNDKSAEEEKRTNFLVVGKDSTSALTDVIMLASFDEKNKSVAVVQLPRDTYAEFSSGSYKKLNGASARLGGEEELCKFLSDTLCVPIDYYVSLELSAFEEIVDAVGGVVIDVPFDMDYNDPAQGLYIHIKKGRQLFDGEGARQFVRYRAGYTLGDVGRIDAQKIFLASLVNKIKNDISVFDGIEIAVRIVDDVNTNIPLPILISLARAAFDVPSDKIEFITLAGEGAVASKSGASYYVISRPSAIEIVNEYLGGSATEESFDKSYAFLNESYQDFSKIYNSYIPYSVYNSSEINREGIEIAHK